jgi:hypothetical protein
VQDIYWYQILHIRVQKKVNLCKLSCVIFQKNRLPREHIVCYSTNKHLTYIYNENPYAIQEYVDDDIPTCLYVLYIKAIFSLAMLVKTSLNTAPANYILMFRGEGLLTWEPWTILSKDCQTKFQLAASPISMHRLDILQTLVYMYTEQYTVRT